MRKTNHSRKFNIWNWLFGSGTDGAGSGG